MSKSIVIVAALVGLIAISLTYGDQNGAVKATSKAMDSVKSAANKGADKVSNLADGVTVRVERFTNPPDHQPGKHNLAMSAVRGVGRLIRNVTVETGNFIGSIGSAGVRLGARIPAAAMGTVREAATRISSPRRKSSSANNDESSSENVQASTTSSDSNNEASGSDDAANEENAQAVEELKKQD